MYENQRDQLSQQSFNIEQTNMAIQGMKDTQVYSNLTSLTKGFIKNFLNLS